MITTQEEKQASGAFYRDALQLLRNSECQFMLGGAFAMFHYTGIFRNTKDLDIFCKSSEYPKILKYFAAQGYETQLIDVRWLVKVIHGEYFIDMMFDNVSNICTVDDSLHERASTGTFMDVPVQFIPVEELIWCKTHVRNRKRNDSADINRNLL